MGCTETGVVFHHVQERHAAERVANKADTVDLMSDAEAQDAAAAIRVLYVDVLSASTGT